MAWCRACVRAWGWEWNVLYAVTRAALKKGTQIKCAAAGKCAGCQKDERTPTTRVKPPLSGPNPHTYIAHADTTSSFEERLHDLAMAVLRGFHERRLAMGLFVVVDVVVVILLLDGGGDLVTA